jgi:putative ABC transport system permease protein
VNSLKVAVLLGFTSVTRGNRSVIVLTIMILTLVGLNLLFVPSLLAGLVSGSNDKLITTYSSDIVVTSRNTTDPLLSGVGNMLTEIDSIPGVTASTPRNYLLSQMSFNGNRATATIYSIDPKLEQQVFNIDRYLIEGSYLAPGDTGQILLGVQIAGADKTKLEFYSRSLQNVHAGDSINVTFGNTAQKTFTVKGIFYAEFIQTDLQAFITEADFDSIVPAARDHAAFIHVKTQNNADLAAIADKINQLGGDLKVFTWSDFAGIMRSMTDSFTAIKTILSSVNVLVAGFTVFILTYIDVTSRRKQIGIQRAIGITSTAITVAYLMRAIFLALLGTVLSALLFHYLVTPIEARYPFHFPFGAVYLEAGPRELTNMAVTLIGVSLIAAFLPVRGVTRMRIMDAIWG